MQKLQRQGGAEKSVRNRSFTVRGFLTKLGLVASGLVIACLALEVILQVGHLVVRRWVVPSRQLSPDERPPGSIGILCEGDSHTFGLGATREESYPAHLQTLLDERCGKGKFFVYNRGIPGSTSDEVLARLAEEVEELEPQVVVLLMGTNNSWKVTEQMSRRARSEGPFRACWLWLQVHSRLVKLLTLVFVEREGLSPHSVEAGRDVPRPQVPDEVHTFHEEAWKRRQRGDFDEALALYRRSLVYAPTHVESHVNIVLTIGEKQRKAEAQEDAGAVRLSQNEAMQGYRRLLRLKPAAEADRVKIERLVGAYYLETYSGPALREFEHFLDKSRAYQPLLQNLATAYAESKGEFSGSWLLLYRETTGIRSAWLHRRVRADYLAAINMAKAKGFSLVMMDYASQEFPDLLLWGIAQEHAVPYVDTAAIFHTALGKGSAELFSDDGTHPNGAGYRLIALSVSDKILSIEKVVCESEALGDGDAARGRDAFSSTRP